MGDRAKKSLGDVIAHVRPRTKTVRVCLRGDLAEQHERLEDELAEARRRDEQTNEPNQAPAIARQIAALEADIKEQSVDFTFQAIGKTAWSDLLAKHPPTKAQKELRLDHNPETFSTAAIAASLVDPGDVTLEQVEQLAEHLSLGQWRRIWEACIAANVDGDDPGESSAASLLLRGSKPSSGTADHAASLEASS